jgi:hypothetical protein
MANRKTYICNCGCNIEFVTNSAGMDIYVITEKDELKIIISESEMANGDLWRNYIPFVKKTGWYTPEDIPLQTFSQLMEYINERIDSHIIYEHLRNKYNSFYEKLKDCKLSWEYVY